MAGLFQELKLDFNREEQIADHTSHRFNLLMRTNSCRKIIGIYVMHQQDHLLLSQLRLTFPPVWME